MNGYRETVKPCCCYFHPEEVVVGICALCLNERLLVLASKQGGHLPALTKDSRRSFGVLKRKPIITLPKVFALGSFIHLLDSHHHNNKHHFDDDDSIASLEDSFISIKFEDDGQASWNKKQGKSTTEPCTNTTNTGKETKELKTMVEHPSHSGGVVRWRKRIGHLLQLGLWKRSSEASATCHLGFGGKLEGGKGGRRGWLRSLTRRTTTVTIH